MTWIGAFIEIVRCKPTIIVSHVSTCSIRGAANSNHNPSFIITHCNIIVQSISSIRSLYLCVCVTTLPTFPPLPPISLPPTVHCVSCRPLLESNHGECISKINVHLLFISFTYMTESMMMISRENTISFHCGCSFFCPYNQIVRDQNIIH